MTHDNAIGARGGNLAITGVLAAIAVVVTIAAAIMSKRRMKMNDFKSGPGEGGSSPPGVGVLGSAASEGAGSACDVGISCSSGAGEFPMGPGKHYTREYYSKRAEQHVSRYNANLVEWADEQLGLRVKFSPQVFLLESEERQAPLLVLRFRHTRQLKHYLVVAVEDCGRIVDSDKEYFSDCLTKLGGSARLLSVTSMRVGSRQAPVAEYCFVEDSSSALTFATSVFMVHGRYGMGVQYIYPLRLKKGLPAAVCDLVQSIQFSRVPRPSPSYILCSEPRLGVGFRVPLNFIAAQQARHTQQQYLSECGGSELAGLAAADAREPSPFSHCTPFKAHSEWGHDASGEFATLVTRDSTQRIAIVAAYEPYSDGLHSYQHAVEQILLRAARRFALQTAEPLFTVFCEGHVKPREKLAREGALVVRPYCARVSTGGNFSGEDDVFDVISLPGYFCIQEVLVDTSTIHGDVLLGFSDGKRRGVAVAFMSVFCVAVGEEYISISTLASTESINFEQFVTFCTRIVDTITLANHCGQWPTLTYCNTRHEIMPFQVSLSAHMIVHEPPLGDPLAVIQCLSPVLPATTGDEVAVHVTVRAFPCARDVFLGGPAMARLEHDVAAWLLQLPRRVELLAQRQCLVNGHPALEVQFEEWLSVDSNAADDATIWGQALDVAGDDRTAEFTTMNPFAWFAPSGSGGGAVTVPVAGPAGQEGGGLRRAGGPPVWGNDLAAVGHLSCTSVSSWDEYGAAAIVRVGLIVCFHGLAFLIHAASPSLSSAGRAAQDVREVGERLFARAT